VQIPALSFNSSIFVVPALTAMIVAGCDAPPPTATAAQSRASTQPASTAAPAFALLRPPDRLKIMTFNIHGGRRGLDPIAKLIREHHPDLVFLQEATPPGTDRDHFDQATYLAKTAGGLHVTSGLTLGLADTTTWDRAILSRAALRDARYLRTKDGADAERTFALHAIWPAAGRPLHLVCVHTKSSPRLDLKKIMQTSRLRMSQLTALLEHVTSLDGDVIIAGDFNAADWMPEYRAVTARWADFGLVNDDAKYTYPSHKPRLRIDYVFGRGQFEARSYRVLDVRLSDHRPVALEIERSKATMPHTAPTTP